MTIKKAVIDIGSLKMKVSIFDTQKRKLMKSFSHLTLLGKGIEDDARISLKSLAMLDTALASTAASLSSAGVSDVVIIGTEALRKASNTNEVVAFVEHHFPLHILEIVDQQREANLFFDAVSREFADHSIVAMDIGGGSVQIVKGRYDSHLDKVEVETKYNLSTGTYRLQQIYSPKNDVISAKLGLAHTLIKQAFEGIEVSAPILVFGSSVMKDFITASGIKTQKDDTHPHHTFTVTEAHLQQLLAQLIILQPDARTHFFPEGGYFMYGADYLLFNLLAAIEKIQPDKIYPTNINSSYAFI